MSGMFESKTDKASRKLARSKQEEKAKRKTRTIAITVISVLLVLSTAAILINSNFIRRNVTVVTIDGVGFSAAHVEYFVSAELFEYRNMMSQFQGMGGNMPDPNRPLSHQIFNPETGETWADVMLAGALANMVNIVSIYKEAEAYGFELPEEQLADIEDEMLMLSMQAMFNGFPNTVIFLQQMYGSGMNENLYREILELISLVGAFNNYKRESIEYTAEELFNYYEDNKDELDVFFYREFTIYAEYLYEEDFDSTAEYDLAVANAAVQARLEADMIAAGISSEDDFLEVSMNYDLFYSDPESTLFTVQGERLNSTISEWMLDAARDHGDITVTDSDYGSSIIFFVSRENNRYNTVGMRQILITRTVVDPEEFLLGELDPDYLEALEQAERELHERAQTVNTLFIAGGSTEEVMIDLMQEHSDDTTPGGEYSNITKYPYQSSFIMAMKVVPEIEDWLFDENRKVGDSELIYTEAYGYHLLYFTGFGKPFFELMAEDRLRTRDHSEWLENLTRAEPVKHAAFILVTL